MAERINEEKALINERLRSVTQAFKKGLEDKFTKYEHTQNFALDPPDAIDLEFLQARSVQETAEGNGLAVPETELL